MQMGITVSLSRYRALAKQVKRYEKIMGKVKQRIAQSVPDGETYKDERGYIRWQGGGTSDSYPTKDVDTLVAAWLTSGNEARVEAARELSSLRQSKPKTRYLVIS